MMEKDIALFIGIYMVRISKSHEFLVQSVCDTKPYGVLATVELAMYAIQNKCSGQLIDYCETQEQALYWLDSYPVEVVDTENASKISVEYTELSGPWGYGHQEESFCTHGGLLTCIRRLISWMQSTAQTFGPDARDIKDFFRHCRLYVNGEDKSQWLFRQMNKLDLKTLYV